MQFHALLDELILLFEHFFLLSHHLCEASYIGLRQGKHHLGLERYGITHVAAMPCGQTGTVLGNGLAHDTYHFLIGIGSTDRKSTRLNSSHANISYAVFCLKKKKTNNHTLLL